MYLGCDEEKYGEQSVKRLRYLTFRAKFFHGSQEALDEAIREREVIVDTDENGSRWCSWPTKAQVPWGVN